MTKRTDDRFRYAYKFRIYPNKEQEILINKSLSFSLGIMLTLSFISLIPEAFSYQKELNLPNTIIILIYIVLGIILSQLIDYYFFHILYYNIRNTFKEEMMMDRYQSTKIAGIVGIIGNVFLLIIKSFFSIKS